MRILMLGWELPPHNSGGLGVACFQMARALAQTGVEIDFLLPSNEVYDDIDFMEVHTVPRKNTEQNLAYSDNFTEISQIQDGYTKKLNELLQKNNYDAIHCHDWLTMKAAEEAKESSGKQLVAHIHSTEFDRAGGNFGNPLIHEIEEQGLLMADEIIAVSKLTKDLIVKNYGINPDKIRIVHNAIDKSELTKIQLEENYRYLKLKQAEGFKIVTTIGRLTTQKGLQFFLDAAAKALKFNEKLLFVLGGDGELRDELIELVASRGIADKVIFTGFVRGAAWRELYDIADIFVMSSVSEPFGLTALEAAAHNNAIILSKQTGVSEQLKSVLLYDFWDTDKLADEIVNLAESNALREYISENALAEFDKFNWSLAANKIKNIYGRLANA